MATIMKLAEADARFFDGELSLWTSCYSNVALVDGDLHIDGDFDGSSIEGARSSEMLIAIVGNLQVSGRIRFYDHTPGLFVRGDIRSETIECGDSELICRGHATLDYFALGSYNDGRMDVHADVPFVISDRGHCVGVAAKGALYIENAGGCDNYDYEEGDISRCFAAAVVGDERIDRDAFYNCLKGGRSVFSHGGDISQEKIRLSIGAHCPACRSTRLEYVSSQLSDETTDGQAACRGCGGHVRYQPQECMPLGPSGWRLGREVPRLSVRTPRPP